MAELRRRWSKSRAVLGWAAVLFVLGQFGLALVINQALPEIGNPFFAVKAERLRHLSQERTTPESKLVLMLGGSRTEFGFDASRLEGELSSPTRPVCAFNFGTLGAGPVTQLLYFRRLAEQGVTPDLLLIEVLPPFLAGQTAEPIEACWFTPSNRLDARELALLRRYRFDVAGLRRTRCLSWTLPNYAHRAALLSRWLPAWLPYGDRLDWAWSGDDHGWTAQRDALPPERRAESVRTERQRYAAALDHFQTTGAPVAALRELLAECRSRRIAAAVVLLPEGSEFRGWYPADAQTQIDALLDDLGRGYGVAVIDGRRWIGDDDFFDAHHLRAHGAAIFSERLGRQIVERGLLGD